MKLNTILLLVVGILFFTSSSLAFSNSLSNQFIDFQYDIVGENLVGQVTAYGVTGYAAIGFNTLYQMPGSHIIMAYPGNVNEYYATSRSRPTLMATQSIFNTHCEIVNGDLVFSFTRPLTNTNVVNFFQINPNTNVTVVFATHSIAPTSPAVFSKHNNKGLLGYEVFVEDFDSDGYGDNVDCNDNDSLVNVKTTYHPDVDGDTYGSNLVSLSACTQPSGFVLNSADCDDSNSKVNPMGKEICNDVDDDCNGSIDDSINGCTVFVTPVAPFRTTKRSAIITKPTGLAYFEFFIYALDTTDNVVRRIDPLTGTSTVFAGQVGVTGTMTDGIGAAALFQGQLTDLALASSVGELFIIDGNRIRRLVISSGQVTTLPGTFTNPEGIAASLSGRRVYVADSITHAVYIIADGNVNVYAGSPGNPGYTNGPIATSLLTQPQALLMDEIGNLYIGERQGSIRTTDGQNVTHIAGTLGVQGSAVGPALGGGQFGEIFSFLLSNNNLYVSDNTNLQIRALDLTTREISIFAGTGGVTSGTAFAGPYALTSMGNTIFVSDNVADEIYRIATCNGQGLSTGTTCECFDGFSGSECQTTPLASCSLLAPSADVLTSSTLPVVNAAQTFYKSDTLNLELGSPLFAYRSDRYSFFNGATCPNQFVETTTYTGSCFDTVNVQVPWVNRVACGFVRDNTDPNFLIWRGEAQADLVDFVGHLRNQVVLRNTIAKYRVAVRFPRTVNVTVYPLNVLSDVNLLAAITYQAVDTSVQPAVATFSFTTSLQWPYQVNVFSLSSAPNGWTASSIVETTTTGMCSNVAGSICMQTFDVFIPTSLASCDIDGSYIYSSSIMCRISDCPALAPALITATVDSEDFCVEVDATADLTGTLTLYRDAARLVQASNFAQNDVAYFRAQLASLAATVESVDLVRVSYWKPGATAATLIYDRVSGTSAGYTFVEETIPTVGETFSNFNFALDQTNFPQWPEDIVSFRVDATVEATFQDTAKRVHKKVLDFSFDQSISDQSNVLVSKSGQVGLRGKLVMIRPTHPVSESSSASSVAISAVVLLLSIILSLLF